jgi:hypothetical protein
MTYHIVLSEDLAVTAEEFAVAWDEAPDCHSLAEAQASFEPPQAFSLDPALQQGLVLLSGVAGAIAVDVLKDLVKERVIEFLEQRRAPKPGIRVEAVRQPGGGYLLVVTEEGP